ncbi:hypothetical protein [Fluviispira sanaruensis]|uniref:Uncharacterized protein n=1 Tax=Fluviispira sanaruensis TaxID=2493639 RepID=A0A4P2VNF4_FLUSA|nr:hypothetical protein [Fluviispira sanaruensis]BBH54631.1 hypothetical protein JCM31447_31050 [Fluviispira sanaruensis]
MNDENKKIKEKRNWNLIIYNLSKFYYFWQIFNPIIFIVLICYIVYLKAPNVPRIEISPALVIENGRVSRLACNSDDEAFKEVAVQLSESLAQILYAYSSSDSYSAKTAAFGINFEENSPSASKFHDFVVRNIELTAKGNSGEFKIDKEKIKAGSLPTDFSIYVVILSGTQLLQSKTGTVSQMKKLSVTFKFNMDRGSDGKVFKIIGFNPDFSSI